MGGVGNGRLPGQKTDILKPIAQRQELAVKRFIESFENANITYTIRIQKYRTLVGRGLLGGTLREFDEYVVTLPEETQNRLDALDKQVLHDTFLDYLGDDRYSFPVAVLMMAEAIVFRPARPFYRNPWKPIAFLQKNKTLWNQNFPQDSANFLESYNGCFTLPEPALTTRGNEELYRKAKVFRDSIKAKSYRYSVLGESIPVSYTNKIFAPADSPVFMAYSDNKKSPDDIFNDSYPAVCYARKSLQHIVPAEWENIRVRDTRKLLNICRENDPATKPYLSALMMALFTVDGYSFDDGTGAYAMNGRGRMLMDFVAEFPVPENATRLQAVMDGGNREEIETMMRKHGTGDKWRELLKNPAHPEFAKYPQD